MNALMYDGMDLTDGNMDGCGVLQMYMYIPMQKSSLVFQCTTVG